MNIPNLKILNWNLNFNKYIKKFYLKFNSFCKLYIQDTKIKINYLKSFFIIEFYFAK